MLQEELAHVYLMTLLIIFLMVENVILKDDNHKEKLVN